MTRGGVQKFHVSTKRYDVASKRTEANSSSRNFRMVEERYQKREGGGIVPTLEVSGFAADIQNHHLNELFSTVGPLVKCKIDYDRLGNSLGVAFIKYERFEDSQTAYKQFHGTSFD